MIIIDLQYACMLRSSGLCRKILQSTVPGQSGRRKDWENNINEWTCLNFTSSQRAAEWCQRWWNIVTGGDYKKWWPWWLENTGITNTYSFKLIGTFASTCVLKLQCFDRNSSKLRTTYCYYIEHWLDLLLAFGGGCVGLAKRYPLSNKTL